VADAHILEAANESGTALIAYVEFGNRPLVPTGCIEE
jgi:hypothetical protein